MYGSYSHATCTGAIVPLMPIESAKSVTPSLGVKAPPKYLRAPTVAEPEMLVVSEAGSDFLMVQ